MHLAPPPMIRCAGFTLVELSIVLVILGLLVGGVLSGQSLIHAAELRTITTEKDKFTTAVYAFRDKYLALPGDIPNAFAFWGTDCGTDDITLSTGCNGNGDGLIKNYEADEGTKAWRHLAYAGLIEGTYTAAGETNNGMAADLSVRNVPTAKFSTGVWQIGNDPCEGCGYGTPSYSGGRSALMLALGSLDATAGAGWHAPVRSLTNTDAWTLDKKVDDGFSYTGRMRGANAWEDCTDNGPNDPYSLSTAADVAGNCNPTFILQP